MGFVSKLPWWAAFPVSIGAGLMGVFAPDAFPELISVFLFWVGVVLFVVGVMASCWHFKPVKSLNSDILRQRDRQKILPTEVEYNFKGLIKKAGEYRAACSNHASHPHLMPIDVLARRGRSLLISYQNAGIPVPDIPEGLDGSIVSAICGEYATEVGVYLSDGHIAEAKCAATRIKKRVEDAKNE